MVGTNLRRRTARWAAGPVLAALVVSAGDSTVPPNLVPNGAVHEEGPPPGHTGGFGEPTCQECHSEFDVNASSGALGVEDSPLGGFVHTGEVVSNGTTSAYWKF